MARRGSGLGWAIAWLVLLVGANGTVRAGTYMFGFPEEGAITSLPAGIMTAPPTSRTDDLLLDWISSNPPADAKSGGHAVFGSLGSLSQGNRSGSFGGGLGGSGGGGGGGSGIGGGGEGGRGSDVFAGNGSSTPELMLSEPTPFKPNPQSPYLPEPLGETPNTEIPQLSETLNTEIPQLSETPNTEIPPLSENTPPPYTPPQPGLTEEDDSANDPGATIIGPQSANDGTNHAPEPGTLSLLSLGVLGLGWRAIRAKRKS